MPNAMSSEKEPVEMQGIATWVQASPRRMMAPSPNCFWICANTLSRSTLVFLVSLVSSGLDGCLGAMGFSLLFTCVGGCDVFLFHHSRRGFQPRCAGKRQDAASTV